jgi:hypothetical protein
MSRLESLRASRDKAIVDANQVLDDLALVLETRTLTEAEVAQRDEATGHVTQLQEAVGAEEVRDAEATAEIAARAALGTPNEPGAGTTEVPEVRSVVVAELGKNGKPKKVPMNVRLGIEPLTYSRANPNNSFYNDLLAAAWTAAPGFTEARERLTRHQIEMDGIRKNSANSNEARLLRSYDNESRRRSSQRAEKRDIATTVGSLGDFSPPLFFLAKYAPWRTYGRTLLSILKSMPLPETGMVFNLPKISQPTIAENQTTNVQGAGENTTVSTRDMTSSYETGAVQTIIDNLLVSQQYLDRVGPGIDGDLIVHDDQTRQLNRLLNGYAWGALLGMAGNGAIPITGSGAFNGTAIAEFKRQVHGAKAVVRRTDGVVAYPTHFISDADVWEQIEGSYDVNGRPYTTGDGQSAFNPIATGTDNGAPEGYSGFKFGGLPAFVDEAAWVYGGELDTIVVGSGTASSATLASHAAVVGAFDIACYWMEGPPVVRVLPQPYAQTLTVLIQQYCYAALVPEYPGALQVLYGSQLADATVTAY